MKHPALWVAIIIVSLVLPAGALAGPAKKPPSFALWYARQSTYTDGLFANVKTGRDVLAVLPKAKAHLQSGITAIEKPQKAGCRKAIASYWSAALKYYAAESIYLRSHSTATAGAIAAALSADEPYATLGSVKNTARSKAVRICG